MIKNSLLKVFLTCKIFIVPNAQKYRAILQYISSIKYEYKNKTG